MNARRAVIGSAAHILLWSPAEFGISHDQRRVPSIELDECLLERNDAVAKGLQQSRVRCRLIAMGVEAVQRQPHDSDASARTDNLCRRAHGRSESGTRKLGAKHMIAAQSF